MTRGISVSTIKREKALKSSNTVVYKLGEKIGSENIYELHNRLEKYLLQSEIKNVVLDMENVVVCDISALHFLLVIRAKAEAAQKKLILMRPPKYLQNLLQITKLLAVFTIADTANALQQM